MNNFIHINEKWFSLKSEISNVYLSSNQIAHRCTTKSKSLNLKVLLLRAVTRHRYDYRKEIFLLQIGVRNFIEFVPAQRYSRNETYGTTEMKLFAVTKQLYQKFLIGMFLRYIKAQCF